MYIVNKVYKFVVKKITLHLLLFVVFINFIFVAFNEIAILLLFV